MANNWQRSIGQTTSRGPTAIMNEQHDDKSLSARNQSGSPGTVDFIIADSTVATIVNNDCVIRVMNTTASVQFIYIGKGSAVPGAAPTITTGIAVAPNSYENFFLGTLQDPLEAIKVKASVIGVQIVVFEI